MRTAVLMLDAKCPACDASQAFYQRLGKRVQANPNLRFLVLTDNDVTEARTWLRDRGVSATHILKITSRARLGVILTPTLMILDSDGRITDLLEKRLSTAAEEMFLTRLERGEGPPLRLASTMTEISLAKSPGRVPTDLGQLVDTRERGAFRLGHSVGAVNIPDDELQARAPAELSRSHPVVIDCLQNVHRYCRSSAMTFEGIGFTRVIVLLP